MGTFLYHVRFPAHLHAVIADSFDEWWHLTQYLVDEEGTGIADFCLGRMTLRGLFTLHAAAIIEGTGYAGVPLPLTAPPAVESIKAQQALIEDYGPRYITPEEVAEASATLATLDATTAFEEGVSERDRAMWTTWLTELQAFYAAAAEEGQAVTSFRS